MKPFDKLKEIVLKLTSCWFREIFQQASFLLPSSIYESVKLHSVQIQRFSKVMLRVTVPQFW